MALRSAAVNTRDTALCASFQNHPREASEDEYDGSTHDYSIHTEESDPSYFGKEISDNGLSQDAAVVMEASRVLEEMEITDDSCTGVIVDTPQVNDSEQNEGMCKYATEHDVATKLDDTELYAVSNDVRTQHADAAVYLEAAEHDVTTTLDDTELYDVSNDVRTQHADATVYLEAAEHDMTTKLDDTELYDVSKDVRTQHADAAVYLEAAEHDVTTKLDDTELYDVKNDVTTQHAHAAEHPEAAEDDVATELYDIEHGDERDIVITDHDDGTEVYFRSEGCTQNSLYDTPVSCTMFREDEEKEAQTKREVSFQTESYKLGGHLNPESSSTTAEKENGKQTKQDVDIPEICSYIHFTDPEPLSSNKAVDTFDEDTEPLPPSSYVMFSKFLAADKTPAIINNMEVADVVKESETMLQNADTEFAIKYRYGQNTEMADICKQLSNVDLKKDEAAVVQKSIEDRNRCFTPSFNPFGSYRATKACTRTQADGGPCGDEKTLTAASRKPNQKNNSFGLNQILRQTSFSSASPMTDAHQSQPQRNCFGRDSDSQQTMAPHTKHGKSSLSAEHGQSPSSFLTDLVSTPRPQPEGHADGSRFLRTLVGTSAVAGSKPKPRSNTNRLRQPAAETSISSDRERGTTSCPSLSGEPQTGANRGSRNRPKSALGRDVPSHRKREKAWSYSLSGVPTTVARGVKGKQKLHQPSTHSMDDTAITTDRSESHCRSDSSTQSKTRSSQDKRTNARKGDDKAESQKRSVGTPSSQSKKSKDLTVRKPTKGRKTGGQKSAKGVQHETVAEDSNSNSSLVIKLKLNSHTGQYYVM